MTAGYARRNQAKDRLPFGAACERRGRRCNFKIISREALGCVKRRQQGCLTRRRAFLRGSVQAETDPDKERSLAGDSCRQESTARTAHHSFPWTRFGRS